MADTLAAVTARLETADLRRQATLPGASLPFLGASAGIADAAAGRADACAALLDLQALQTAFAPVAPQTTEGTAPEGTAPAEPQPAAAPDFCATPPLDGAALWESLRADPSAAWATARAAHPELPEVSLSGTYAWLLGQGQRIFASLGLSEDGQ